MKDNPLSGVWTYRSFINDPDIKKAFNDLQFGIGTMVLSEAPFNVLKGTIGGDGWSLALSGSRTYGNPMQVRFQGSGMVNGEQWIYDYEAYLCPVWPNGVQQRPALVGTIVRTVPHKNSSGGINPAGVVASWIAVRRD